MEYKVIPFNATINRQTQTTLVIANQLENTIKQFNSQGWEYVRLESVSTYIQPDKGCFGLDDKPGYLASYQMLVFCKS